MDSANVQTITQELALEFVSLNALEEQLCIMEDALARTLVKVVKLTFTVLMGNLMILLLENADADHLVFGFSVNVRSLTLVGQTNIGAEQLASAIMDFIG